KADRNDRIEKPAHDGAARHQQSERDAADRGDEKSRDRAIEREAGVDEQIAAKRVMPYSLDDRAQRWQLEQRHSAAAGVKLARERKRHDGKHTHDAAIPRDGAARRRTLLGCMAERLEALFYSRHRKILCIKRR